jgi:hypothetical protein
MSVIDCILIGAFLASFLASCAGLGASPPKREGP